MWCDIAISATVLKINEYFIDIHVCTNVGARAHTNSILEKLSEFTEVESKLKEKQAKLHEVEKELNSLKHVAEK